ncbi:hypothetical protein LXE06_06140 [Yersinia enterocolitica]|uniref:hypothetical protein n=1 Tax=Yersinia enterocolitica TaxID=630 RepID=UPI001E641AFF|nr:hypothetical protein [Yersinia enterocolitica]MCE3086595.1 hypothetical protein [Yersinia enterocolitica]UNA06010.1 hypothetical protein vBYenM3014_015 [Yersinia phage vB_YenM_30.14]
MITCNKCHIEQPVDNYYPRNRVCKKCTKARVSEYQRGDGKKIHNISSIKYNKTDKGRIAAKKAEVNYSNNHRERKLAHWAVRRAIKKGKLERIDSCESCRSPCHPQAHHCDYTKPLEVMWLCQSCHVEWHKNNTPIYETKAA